MLLFCYRRNREGNRESFYPIWLSVKPHVIWQARVRRCHSLMPPGGGGGIILVARQVGLVNPYKHRTTRSLIADLIRPSKRRNSRLFRHSNEHLTTILIIFFTTWPLCILPDASILCPNASISENSILRIIKLNLKKR